MSTITVELNTPLQYAMKGRGEEVEANFLEVKEPTGKHAHLLGVMRAQLGAATKKSYEGLDLGTLADVADNNNGDDDPLKVGDGLYQVLTMGGADMTVVMLTFKDLMRATALAGGEKELTGPMYDRLAYSDVEQLLKAYLGHFLAASE